MIRTITATRYVTPLREGGSLPAIIEADDDGMYVLKFRGAGQGPRALIAELLAGEVARRLGLPVPEIVFVDLDPALGRSEPDSEIRALITTSAGLNLALDYLPGALGYAPRLAPPEPRLASAIVWFDAYVMNVDRTPRNPNLLRWGKRLWLIDHGAALYIHHTWHDYQVRGRGRFPQIRDHLLLPYASALAEVDAEFSARLTPTLIHELVALIPEGWLTGEPSFESQAAERAAYVRYLTSRLEAPRLFVQEAADARTQLV